MSQTDKHSDLTLLRVTVMAVAAESHRDFLIPEDEKLTPDNESFDPMICVYSFVCGSTVEKR